MTAELRRSIFLACVGLLGGFALVVTLYGASGLFKHGLGSSAIQSLTGASGETERRDGEAAPNLPGKSQTMRTDQAPVGGTAATGKAAPVQASGQSESPTFDIIRVEPTGETVIAGRAAPNTTVELLRDNQPIARVLVDPSGQFAIVPPALPAGNSEITLRGTGADGQARNSRESVVVVVAPGRDTKPLIALTAPDKPTVVLSQPDPVGTGQAASEKTAAAAPGGAAPGKSASSEANTPAGSRAGSASSDTARAPLPAQAGKAGAPAAGTEPAGTGPVKIVSVEAEEGGKLYVTSQAPPGATVRLYLNDALVAPGSVGADGRVAFTIGRGIRPGGYKVRVDQVDPVSGKVKTRSEVNFTVPAAAKPVAAASAPPATAATAKSAEPEGSGTAATNKTPSPRVAEAQTRSASPTADSPTAGPEAPTDASAGRSAAERPGTVFVPEIGTARIIRGDSLWQISRRIYGKGTRYTVIFDANQPQIRNPDRIYPGQIFVLPSEGAAAGSQAATRG